MIELIRRATRSGIVLMLLGVVACDRQEAAPPDLPVGNEVGQVAPELAGELPDGSEFSLGHGGGQAIIVFYRGGYCGLCRLQLTQIQENLAAYRTAGARVVGVSLESPADNSSTAGELGLDYELVSVDTAAFRTWGVEFSDAGLPRPATFVVDRSGVIQFRHIGQHAADRATDADLLTVLGQLGDR